MKKFSMLKIIFSLIGAIILLPNNFSQSIIRQCISSWGASTVVDEISISQTTGQSYYTTGSSDNIVYISQGFQQSGLFLVESTENLLNVKSDIIVYPNPAKYIITFKNNGEIIDCHIRINDIQGKHIYSEFINNFSSWTINCSSWKNGIYIITISDSKDRISTLKITIFK